MEAQYIWWWHSQCELLAISHILIYKSKKKRIPILNHFPPFHSLHWCKGSHRNIQIPQCFLPLCGCIHGNLCVHICIVAGGDILNSKQTIAGWLISILGWPAERIPLWYFVFSTVKTDFSRSRAHRQQHRCFELWTKFLFLFTLLEATFEIYWNH